LALGVSQFVACPVATKSVMSYITQRNEQYQEKFMNVFRRSMFHGLLTRLKEPRRL